VKRIIGILLILAGLNLAVPDYAASKTKTRLTPQARAGQKTANKQQKALRKYYARQNKAQKKAQKKSQKQAHQRTGYPVRHSSL